MTVTILPTEHTKPQEDKFSINVLLVDDQNIINEAVSRMLHDQPDIKLHYCSDPTKAVQMAMEIKPTLILQDLVMPEVDGITLVKFYRATTELKDVPLIVLSSKEEPIIKAEAFAVGANDYLVKLPDRIELIARIRYHSASYIRLLERNLAYKRLKESQDALKEELDRASRYVRSLLPKKITGDITTDWQFVPCEDLGGDSFGYHWLDQDRFVFYLLDVCGHGVGAALLSITVMNVLRSESLHVDYSQPDQVLEALNSKFPMEEHNNMFFTLCYGIYDKKTRQVTLASGGHPPPVLVHIEPDGKKTIKQLIVYGGPVIGAVEGMDYPTMTEQLAPGDIIYIYSDGLFELTMADGKVMELDNYLKIFAQEGDKTGKVPEVERVFNYSKEVMRGNPFADDVAVVEIKTAL